MASPPSSSSTEAEFQAAVNDWVAHSKSLRLVFFGKTGTGKSSLINTLFGKEVAKEGRSIRAETKAVECYTETITVIVNDVSVTIWDTPGLKDPFSDGKKTIQEIQDKCLPDVDLFVYCTNFNQTRLGQDDVDCIKDITAAFGADIWKRAVFALTFANKASVPPLLQATLEDYVGSREKEWGEGFRGVVRDSVNLAEFPIVKVNSIPVVATGYRKQFIPGKQEWFNDFWVSCLSQIAFNSMPSLIRTAGEHIDRHITGRVVGQRLADIGDSLEGRPVKENGGALEDVKMTGRAIGYELSRIARKIEDERKKESGNESNSNVPIDPSQVMDYLEEGFRIDRSKGSDASQRLEAVQQEPTLRQRTTPRVDQDGGASAQPSNSGQDQADNSSSGPRADDAGWGAKLLVAVAAVLAGAYILFRNR